MQGTANVHDHLAPPVLPHPEGLCAHAAACDTALDLCDAHPSPRQRAVVRLLCWGPRGPARFLRGLEDLHALQRAPWHAQLVPPRTPRRPQRRRRVGQALVVDAARRGLTQAHEAPRGMEQPAGLPPRPLCLPARARGLVRRIVGARDGSCGAVLTNRGRASDGAAGTGADRANAQGTGGHSAPRAGRTASPRRQGASPTRRQVGRRPGRQTGIPGVAWDWRRPHTRPGRRGRVWCVRETTMHNRRSAGVGRGECLEVGERRACRRRPWRVQAARASKHAAAQGGTKAAHSSTVTRVKSQTAVVWGGIARYRNMRCASCRRRHSITQIVMNSILNL